MKSFLNFPRALLAASLLAVSALPTLAADAKTEALRDAQDELAILKNKYTDEHPRVVEQKQRIAQLQRRIDENRRTPIHDPIIRTEVRILMPKDGGGSDLLANPTLITRPGQNASLSIGAISIDLGSSVDDQNNITTNLELSMDGIPGKPAEKEKLPAVRTRPGERAVVPFPGGPKIEIVASFLEPKGISVDFPGGSLAQLLDAISKSSSEPFNMIASNDALALNVPAFSIRNAGSRDLAEALAQFLPGYRVDLPAEKADRDGQPIFTIKAREPVSQENSGSRTRRPNTNNTSYPLTQFLQGQIPVDQVIDSINQAWALDPSNKPEDLKVKYHEATGILMISSRDERGLPLVERVISSLREQAQYLAVEAAQQNSATTPKPAPKF